MSQKSNVYKRMLEAMGVTETITSTASKILSMMPTNDTFREFFDQSMSKIADVYEQVYSEHFTKEEAERLIAIHEDPAMKKMTKDRVILNQKIEAHMRLYMIDMMQKASPDKVQEIEQLPVLDFNKKLN